MNDIIAKGILIGSMIAMLFMLTLVWFNIHSWIMLTIVSLSFTCVAWGQIVFMIEHGKMRSSNKGSDE